MIDLAAVRASWAQALERSPEIDRLTAQLDVNDVSTIVTFGADAARQLSRAADEAARAMKVAGIYDTDDMLSALERVMHRFDPDDFNDAPAGVASRIFGRRDKTDLVLEKYADMTVQVDKLYVMLRQYSDALKRDDMQLRALFDAGIDAYAQLVKYVLSAEQGCREIRAYIDMREHDPRAGRDPLFALEMTGLRAALDALDRRTRDLRVAEVVALQTLPMLEMMISNNASLIGKLDDAFLVTLPVFKQGVGLALAMKRRQVEQQALRALDRRTRRDVAQAGAEQLTSGATALESIENARKIILKGVEEARAQAGRAGGHSLPPA